MNINLISLFKKKIYKNNGTRHGDIKKKYLGMAALPRAGIIFKAVNKTRCCNVKYACTRINLITLVFTLIPVLIFILIYNTRRRLFIRLFLHLYKL